MEYRSGSIGRVLWARFEDGEDVRLGLEDLARRERVHQGLVMVLGALKEAQLVAGPREPVIPPEPLHTSFCDGREILGIGTLAQGPDGPDLHLHLTAGRETEPVVLGCLRREGRVYLLVEAVIIEVENLKAFRRLDARSNLNLLNFE